MPCGYIKNIQVNPKIQINFIQLNTFFELEFRNGMWYQEAGNKYCHYSRAPSGINGRSLVFVIEDENITHFGSGTCDLKQLTKLFNDIPNELQPLKSQLLNLLSVIEHTVLQEEIASAREKHEIVRYLHQIDEAKTTDILRRTEIKPRHSATQAEVLQAEIVMENSFLVRDIGQNSTVYLGTANMGSCLTLVIFNPSSRRIGLAHLHDFTIETYKESLINMVEACGGSLTHPNEMYIIGCGHIFSRPITMDYKWQCLLDTTVNCSRALAFSLYEFIDSRSDSVLKGICFSDTFLSGNVLVAASTNKCEIFTADDEFTSIMTKNEEKATLIGCPSSYTQLVDLSLCTPRPQAEPIAYIEAQDLNLIDSAAAASDISHSQPMEQLSQEDPCKLFFEKHRALFAKSKNSCCGFFRKTKVSPSWSIEEIIQHARQNNNRSREACVQLGWIKRDGTLTKNFLDRFTFCNRSNYSTPLS